MEYVIDLNVILDILLDREPFVEDSIKVLNACKKRIIKGYICANNVDTLFYMLHKHLHSKQKCYEYIEQLLTILRVISLLSFTIYDVLDLEPKDFEDGIIAMAAKASKCDGIITRNKKDFADFGIEVITPKEFVELYC